MISMRYADVCVDSPVLANEGIFSYSVPEGMSVRIGQAVIVPFGKRIIQGIVVGLPAEPQVESVKDIAAVIGDNNLIRPDQIVLAKMISNYYKCPLYSSVSLFLPPGFNRQSVQYVWKTDKQSAAGLSANQQEILNRLDNGPCRISLFDKNDVHSLIEAGLVRTEYRLGIPRVKPKYEVVYRCKLSKDAFDEKNRYLVEHRMSARAKLLSFIYSSEKPLSMTEIKNAGHTNNLVNLLVADGLIEKRLREVIRGTLNYPATSTLPYELTYHQKIALSEITKGISKQKGDKYLLQGVTGSGKTEVYLRSAEAALNKSKQVIVLVPELTLASQIIKAFSQRFPGRVSILHSGMTLGERYDQWRQIKAGKCDIVIGARSAVFSPVENIGLIVIDEEHEYAYKQSDSQPLYHATRIAETICKMTGCVLVLGSATPDVCTRYGADHKRYELLELPRRINGSDKLDYRIVNMCDEVKNGNTSIFSKLLRDSISETLKRGEQVILFLNRRGDGQFVQCHNCGYVVKCKSCNIAMTYHSDINKLICHRCDAKKKLPDICPSCKKSKLTVYGIGTQTVEREVARLFPKARMMRWDGDSVKNSVTTEKLISSMANKETDILIGTQSIAKGLHFPFVTLVGVVSADMSLNMPDFRACERTFQIISQAAGRAGRGDKPGTVIIQTYQPDNYAITSTKTEYDDFYRKEIKMRKEMGYPPFSSMAIITGEESDEEKIVEKMQALKERLIKHAGSMDVSVSILGPTPSFISRRRGKYRYELNICGQVNRLLEGINIPREYFINKDPLGL